MVLELERGGAAERASLLPGDLLVGVDNTGVRCVEDLSDALEVAGRTVTLGFLRGSEKRIRLTTGVAV